ncbi:DUF59 domain-containing protein [Planctomycetota bacterium]|nr:DUF59 domain-containing protein [Planctomycetota bacterium]
MSETTTAKKGGSRLPLAGPKPSESGRCPMFEGEGEPLDDAQRKALEEQVIVALKTVNDPEIPINIYDLGLIYEVDVRKRGHVYVRMTLTAPNCPVAGSLPGEVEQKVSDTSGVDSAKVELVWDPPFDRNSLSMEAKFALGLPLD